MKSLRRFAPMGGRFGVDWAADLPWTEWPKSRGLSGRIQWNTHPSWRLS
ncbi:unnamed protein product [marine sediment metagenome]|uniref:Uncharacterized protein n=1 Tax=marine sediment metagenome TaxID=412755 RepID=X0Y5F3_9ZZZZ